MFTLHHSFADFDFDAYWDEEARNPNRNRIRIGRQYQAQVPPLLKSSDQDSRKLSDLETLCYDPSNRLTDAQLEQYFAIAKAIGLMTQAIDTCQDGLDDKDCDDLPEQPFEILEDDSARTFLSESSQNSTKNLSKLSHSNHPPTTRQKLQKESENSEQSVECEPLEPVTNVRILEAMKGLV